MQYDQDNAQSMQKFIFSPLSVQHCTSVNIVSYPETTPTCVERVPFCTSGRGIWVRDYHQHTYMHIDHPQCRSIMVGSKWNTATACTLLYMMPGMCYERCIVCTNAIRAAICLRVPE